MRKKMTAGQEIIASAKEALAFRQASHHGVITGDNGGISC